MSELLAMDGKPLAARAPQFDDESQYRVDIMRRLGELDDIMLLFNDVLVAKYIREKVSENLISSHETQREDLWQGVCGLVLKLGPSAFQDDEHNKFPWEAWLKAGYCREVGQPPIKPGDWVLFRNSDGWDKGVQLVGEYQMAQCRVIQDAHIRGIVKYPGRLF